METRTDAVEIPPGWTEIPTGGPPHPSCDLFRAFQKGGLRVILGRERLPGEAEHRWHLSVSRPSRLPTWEDVKLVRNLFLPEDLHFVIPMPARRYWINVHDYCLHLHEIRDEALTEQFEYEGSVQRAAEAGLVVP